MKTIYDSLQHKSGFPSEWSKNDLRQLLKEAYELISRPVGGIDLNRVQPIISVATNELAGRAAKINLIASLTISVMALLLSIWATYRSDSQSKHWEENQLRVLNEIRASVNQK